MKYDRKSLENGFTLIELAIYGGLLGILLTIMSQFFVSTMELKTVTDNESAVQMDGRYILSRIGYDIQRASSITIPIAGQTGSTLSAIIRENGVDVTYLYAVNSQDLILTSGTVSAMLNSTGSRIADFSLSRVGNSATIPGAKDTIKIQLTVEGAATTSSGRESHTFNTSIGLR